MRTWITQSAEETEALGEKLGRTLKGGELIALCGGLGAGKTAFTRGLARGLDITDRVTSPTYTIVNEYSGRVPLYHFDLYRLAGPDDLFEIGWEDYLTRGGVIAVEWSEVAEELMETPIRVALERISDETRKITIEGVEALETAGI